ncbi:MAG: hypothetical protein JO146_06975 [Candidatus Eremiobacteraeota bacterium]|nr:hypothetical protein [Candidatus Eremiobacteraeota bacterium]
MIVSFNVRTIIYGAAAIALMALCSPDAIRSALAASASALVEATPFLFAGIALSLLLKRHWRVAEYVGCGCGAGPSARSLPATAATWLLFGPYVALARFGAASIAGLVMSRTRTHCDRGDAGKPGPLGELAAMLPAALLAGIATQFGTLFDATHRTPIESVLGGALFGFLAAPCGIGAVAVAGALRERDPVAAAGFLCVAGILDVRALRARSSRTGGVDAFAYLMLAAALGIVASRHGDALVHPAFAVPVACCAIAATFLALFASRQRCASVRIAPAAMLAGALLGAPPPRYHATETTMRDLFAGEELSFTGTLVRTSGSSALVRYAITCCRADAAPIAVRLERPPPYETGAWLRVNGVLEDRGGDMRLRAQRIERISAPGDPFLYR